MFVGTADSIVKLSQLLVARFVKKNVIIFK